MSVTKFTQQITVSNKILRLILHEIFSKKLFPKAQVEKITGIGRRKLSAFSGIEKGAGGQNSELSAAATGELLKFCEGISQGRYNVHKTDALNTLLNELLETLKDNERNRTESGYERVIDIDASITGFIITKEEFDLLDGQYLTFRWRPNQDFVVVSVIKFFRNEDGLVTWRNDHPDPDNPGEDTIPYQGIVLKQGNYFFLIGQRDDHRFFNIIALRQPRAANIGIHGIGLVESDDSPTISRIYFLKKDKDDITLTSYCDAFTEKEFCTEKLGLPNEDFISLKCANDSDDYKSRVIRG